LLGTKENDADPGIPITAGAQANNCQGGEGKECLVGFPIKDIVFWGRNDSRSTCITAAIMVPQ
jgi:hypothetical protein